MYRTVILPVVLYGCEPWSQALREKHSLRVFENRLLRRIFIPKRDEVQKFGENCIIRKLISLQNISRMIKSKKMRWAEHVT
jgi:hypothetical protein